jgi:surface antigen
MLIQKCTISFILALLITIGPALALAKPPPHAPAHGWRSKNDPLYTGHSGRQWPNDFGILSGRCNREAVATVIGGVAGAAIGSTIGDSDDRVIAVIVGAAAGVLIGNAIGRELDEADRACVGHALEIGKPGQTLSWNNASTGVAYEMELLDEEDAKDLSCRTFSLAADRGTRRSERQGTACLTDDGSWTIDRRDIELMVSDKR